MLCAAVSGEAQSESCAFYRRSRPFRLHFHMEAAIIILTLPGLTAVLFCDTMPLQSNTAIKG